MYFDFSKKECFPWKSFLSVYLCKYNNIATIAEIATAATYVKMVMCDNVYNGASCNGFVLVCVLCSPLPFVHVTDFYEFFYDMLYCASFYMNVWYTYVYKLSCIHSQQHH